MPDQIQKIKELVANNQEEEAIALLLKTADAAASEREYQSGLLLSARFRQYGQNKINNTLPEQLLGTEIATIRQSIIELANNLTPVVEEGGDNKPTSARLDSAYNFIIKSLLLLLMVISISVLIIGVIFPQLFQGEKEVEDGRLFLFGVSTTGIASSAFFYPRFTKKSA